MASIYVHFPFCMRKCIYCDFYSVTKTEDVETFLGALTREITLSGDRYKATAVSTIFFGGGTPSLLEPSQLERIFLGLRSSGVNLARLRRDFGYNLLAHRGDFVRDLIDERLAFLEGEVLRLTPRGYLVCDEICQRLLPS